MVDGAPVALAQAWRLAAERLGDASAADALSLGEAAVRSLIGRGLVVLCQPRAPGADADAPGAATAWQDVPEDRVEAALRAVDSWADGAPGALQIARKG
jgi:hypothetical protein